MYSIAKKAYLASLILSFFLQILKHFFMKHFFFTVRGNILSLILIVCTILMIVTSSAKAQGCSVPLVPPTLTFITANLNSVILRPSIHVWAHGCSFRVYYRDNYNSTVQGTVPYTPGSGNLSITSLPSGASYYFELQKQYSYGWGPASELASVNGNTLPGGSCTTGVDAGVYVNINNQGQRNLGTISSTSHVITTTDDIRGNNDDWYEVTTHSGELSGVITGYAVNDLTNGNRIHIAGVYIHDPWNANNNLYQVWRPSPNNPFATSFSVSLLPATTRKYYIFVKNGGPCYSSPYTLTLRSTPGVNAAAAGICPSSISGDCNGDGIVNAGDLTATSLEIFDGDGNSTSTSVGGTVVGRCGCDSNRDGVISAGDLTCTSYKIFNPNYVCGGGSSSYLISSGEFAATMQMAELLISEFAEKGSTPEDADIENMVNNLTRFIESVNIDNNSDVKHEIKIFPNPSASSIFVSGVSDGAEVELFDLSGRSVQVRSFSSGNVIKIDADDVPAGYYFLRIENAQTGELTTHPVSIVK